LASRNDWPGASLCEPRTANIVAAIGLCSLALIGTGALTLSRQAKAVPAFAQQTGQPCKSCHVGGFGPELTPFGREFKLGGYTLRSHASVPLAAMAVFSVTHTQKDQDPPPPHLDQNNNLVLDQASIFLAGGIGNHLGGFAQVTYDGVARHSSWDNLDLRAVTKATILGADSILGVSLNNNPTVQDPWNTLPAWSFPFTDTAVSPTPAAAPLIDGSLAQNVLGISTYAWADHYAYVEVGGYSSPPRRTLNWLGADPFSPGSIRGLAPYVRAAIQRPLAGGTFELGASAFRAAVFPGRDRSSGLADHYMDTAVDFSWQRPFGSDNLSANLRFINERASLRASCALGLFGAGTDLGCARYRLSEGRAAIRYTFRDRLGLTVSAFQISGSRNTNVFGGNGLADSNGLLGQIDYTFWPDGKGPLGPLFNVRVGAQYTLYGKFNGARHNFDGAGANAADNNALRLFTWIAF
jgi:hypothetical protein